MLDNPSHLMSLIDLTSLNETDTVTSIAQCCDKSKNDYGQVAAICVYPRFISQVATYLETSTIQLATVINFPEGKNSLDQTLLDIENAKQAGASELDVVFPYHHFLKGNEDFAFDFVQACRESCGQSVLKIILEVGVYHEPSQLLSACECALHGGANFIKSSTGKIERHVTLETARIMLNAIKNNKKKLKHVIGCKFSGGIREVKDANDYLTCAEEIMGKEWISPQTCRIGASQLVDNILRGKI